MLPYAAPLHEHVPSPAPFDFPAFCIIVSTPRRLAALILPSMVQESTCKLLCGARAFCSVLFSNWIYCRMTLGALPRSGRRCHGRGRAPTVHHRTNGLRETVPLVSPFHKALRLYIYIQQQLSLTELF